MDEGGAGHPHACELDLARRDIDARERKARGEPPCGHPTAAAAELEHPRPGFQLLNERSEVLWPRRVHHAPGEPLFVGLGRRVVADLHHASWVTRHGSTILPLGVCAPYDARHASTDRAAD